MTINWKVRLKNKTFWLTLIPLLFLIVQQVCGLFGVELLVDGIAEQVLAIVETAFLIIGVLGIANDPTTQGLNDSEQAMAYQLPKGK